MIIAYVENFSRHNVATKATDDEERNVNNLAMLVFGKPAGLAQEDTTRVLIAEPVYVTGKKMSFVINTTVTDDGNGQYISNLQSNEPKSFKAFAANGGDLKDCRMYIVANINHLLENKISINSTEKDFLDIGDHILTSVPQAGSPSSSINIPGTGFPMVGWMNVDLSEESSLSGNSEALTVSMKKLFAKVNFKFLVEVNTETDWGSIQTPYFEPIEWSVHNIPTNYTLRDSVATDKPVNTVFYTENFTSFNFSTEKAKATKRIENSPDNSEYFDFSFYMPEYKVLPKRNRTSLPSNIEDHLRQCHKPTFCDAYQLPTYVQIKGKFSNHQGHISEVQYRLYLGQNEIDDFQILRNQELNNTAIIKGVSNHSGGQNQISVDHRVDITSSGYSIAMERETLLDSHFEFRPMDISVQEGAVVVVKLPQNNWFGAELHNPNNNSGIYDSAKPGLRRFFTTSLLNELGSTTSTKEFVFKAINDGDGIIDEKRFRLWFYFDENVANPYDDSKPESETNKLYREQEITVDYYESEAAYNNGAGTPTQADRKFTFRQMNLWVINGHITESQYNIEYFEEYLYNYASDDNYGVTKEGMKWGLNNVPLSTQYQALYASPSSMGGLLDLIGWSLDGLYNDLFKKIDAKYDFYLERDFPDDVNTDIVKLRDYSGINFTQEIANKTGIINKMIGLSERTESAVEYCYHKNKRNQYGEVETIHWYLPAIDETEEILVDGFSYFPVFQAKWYWSSQPAYDRYNYTASSILGSGISSSSGYYYKDDLDRARATKVTTQQQEYPSGVTGAVANRNIELSILLNTITNYGTEVPTDVTPTYDEGNRSREEEHRIRCVYDKTGITAVVDPRTRIVGSWTVTTSPSNSTSGDTSTIGFTITLSDDESKGNVKLSNYFHHNYHSTDYPQYGTYNDETRELTIEMGQNIGRSGWNTNITSVLFEGTTKPSTQKLVLKYDSTTNSFIVVGNNVNIRDSKNSTPCYIQSITRAN